MFLVFFNQINPIPVFTKDTQRSRGASSTLEHLILLDNRLISYKTSLLGPPSSSSWASRMLYCSSPVAGTLSGVFAESIPLYSPVVSKSQSACELEPWTQTRGMYILDWSY